MGSLARDLRNGGRPFREEAKYVLVGLYLASIDQRPVPIRSLPAIILMHEDALRIRGDTSEARGTCQIYSRQLATH